MFGLDLKNPYHFGEMTPCARLVLEPVQLLESVEYGVKSSGKYV